MSKVFVNHTNHPSDKWSNLQRQSAEVFGDVYDLPFPQIPASMDEMEIKKAAAEYAEKIIKMNPAAVLCQGEFCYTFALTEILKKQGIRVICACSERCSHETVLSDGTVNKVIDFRFFLNCTMGLCF